MPRPSFLLITPPSLGCCFSSIAERRATVGVTAQCFTCKQEHRHIIKPINNCTTPAKCYCNICRQQPPFCLLRLPIESSTSFSISVWTDKQHNITNSRCMTSIQTECNWKLLPPDYPNMHVQLRFCCPLHKLYLSCPGKGSRHGEFTYDLGSRKSKL